MDKISTKVPEFKQPPWVIGSQKEVMEWIEATHPSKKEKKPGQKREEKTYKNLHMQLDIFDEPIEIIHPSKIMQVVSKIFNMEKVEEQFELNFVGEIVLRALAKAKFRNTGKIIVDGKIAYDHPEITTDLRKTIEVIKNISKGNNLEIIVISQEIKHCQAKIQIKRIHKKKDHAIDIQIKGEIREEIVHIFLNYLKEKLDFSADEVANQI
jgi:hypothetical protein